MNLIQTLIHWLQALRRRKCETDNGQGGKKSSAMSSLLVAMACSIFTPSALVRAEGIDGPPRGFHGLIGYRQIYVGDYRFVHDTHPDDFFLPDAGKPGSAGVTEIGNLHFISFGGGYAWPMGRRWSVNLDMGGLGGPTRDEHQNDNDDRPPATGAFVFSKANWGVFAALGLNYHIGRLSLGAEGGTGGVWLQSGWDRYERDQTEHTEFRGFVSGGPKIGVHFSEEISLEATVQFGRATGFGVSLKRWF